MFFLDLVAPLYSRQSSHPLVEKAKDQEYRAIQKKKNTAITFFQNLYISPWNIEQWKQVQNMLEILGHQFPISIKVEGREETVEKTVFDIIKQFLINKPGSRLTPDSGHSSLSSTALEENAPHSVVGIR